MMRRLPIDITKNAPPDNGCAVSPSCLTCPRARCIYDDGEPRQNFVANERYRRIAADIPDGPLDFVTVDRIARAHGVSTRTVTRARARAGGTA